MTFRSLLLGTLLQAAILQGAPSEPDPPAKVEGALAAEPRFSLDALHQDIEVVLGEYARITGVSLTIPDLPLQLVTIHFKNQTFEKGLALILATAGLAFHKVEEAYVVGFPMDLKLHFPENGETVLDAVYRCRRVGAASMKDSISAVLPDLKITVGPSFLTPIIENGGGSSSETSSKTLGETKSDYRTHDLLFSGPAQQVRRALEMAQKFDRSRKQVRITVKIVQVNSDDTKDLGISWQPSLPMSFKENADPSTGLVAGIRLGSFSHSPMVVNATLNALESRGRAKTLSNPTLTLLDGERSFILSGQKYYYPIFKGTTNSGNADYGMESAKVGIYLQVGVQIGLDNDMILSLFPSVTSLIGFTNINNANYPSINTSEEQTTVRATSGEVIVLGGMIQDVATHDRSGLPFLSRIPVLGRLFSSSSDTKTKAELMLILTPELVEETLPRTDVKVSVTTPGH